jgi:hypothetical protein
VYGHNKAKCKKYTGWLEKKGITKHIKTESWGVEGEHGK